MNNRGFVAVTVLTLLPVLLLATTMTAWLGWFGFQKQSVEKICYHNIYKAQEALVQSSLGVIALNPKAMGLIKAKKYWQMIARTAPPQLKPIAIANVQRIRAQQYLLKLKQKAIQKKGTALAKVQMSKLHVQLTKRLNKVGGAWSKQKSFGSVQVSTNKPQIKRIFREIAPPYKVKNRYRHKQQLSAQWRVQLKNDYPNLLVTDETKNIWRGECFSHPTLKGGVWRASLGKAKSL